MKLTNIRNIGRYKNISDNRKVNMKRGRKIGRAVDVVFYLESGTRQFISDDELYRSWIKVDLI